MDSNNFDRLTGKLANATSRRQALKLIAGGLAGGVLAAKGSSMVAAPKELAGGINLPTVEVLDAAGDLVGTGAVTPTAFATDGEVLTAIGNIVDGAGNIISGFTSLVDLVQTAETAECDVLNLVLGPLDLNVLGLQVDLAQVVLDITAVPGPGNLLGNLLCAVAGLLDRGGPLQGLTGLLNNILRQLGLA